MFITFQMRKEDFVLTDFLLIQKMKQGNEQAFDTFVRKYYNEILKYCSLFLHCYSGHQNTWIPFFIVNWKTMSCSKMLSKWVLFYDFMQY